MQRYTLLIPRYLWAQKRRSLLTIVGLALAVALMVSTGLLITSLVDSQIQRARLHHGSYHVTLKNISPMQFGMAVNHVKTARVGKVTPFGMQRYEQGVALIAYSYDEHARALAHLSLDSGRFPKNVGEIAIEAWLLQELGLTQSLDQVIPLQLTTQSATPINDSFILVGVLTNTSTNRYTGYSRALVSETTIVHFLGVTAQDVDALIEISPHYAISPTVPQLQRDLQLFDDQVWENVMLLSALEGAKHMIPSYLFLGFLVIVTTVAAIYNVFHIAVVQRMEQFGLLRCIGAAPHHISRIVLGEAIILSLISIPVGLLLGVGGVYALVYGVGVLADKIINIVFPPWIIGVAAGISLVSIYLAAVRPAKVGQNVPPIQALRLEQGVLKEQQVNPRVWHKLLQWCFGFYGRFAYLNLMRQRKRFAVTVFSLSMGLALFVALGYVTLNANPALILENEFPAPFQLRAQSVSPLAGYEKQHLDTLQSFAGVTKVNAIQERGVKIQYPLSSVTAAYQDLVQQLFKRAISADPSTGLVSANAGLYGYSSEFLQQAEHLLIEGSINSERLFNGEEVLLVNFYTSRHGAVPVTTLGVGDYITLSIQLIGANEALSEQSRTFRIGGILKSNPQQPQLVSVGVGVVMDHAAFQQFTGSTLYKRVNVYTQADQDYEVVEAQLLTVSQSIHQGRLISYWEELAKLKQEQRQFTLLALSLIGVIVIISIASIVNTISTNLLLRTREFGTLRALGLSNQQLRCLISWEGLLYGLTSGFFGGLNGIGWSYVAYWFMIHEASYLSSWQVPWAIVLFAAGGGILLCYLATLLPLHQIRQQSIVNAIKAVE